MNVIDFTTRRPVGQPRTPYAEIEILDGFADYKKPDDLVTVEIQATRQIADAIMEELEAMQDAARATWEARSNVVDFKTRRALELQASMSGPELITTARGVLIECFLRRDQADSFAQRLDEANRASAMSVAV